MSRLEENLKTVPGCLAKSGCLKGKLTQYLSNCPCSTKMAALLYGHVRRAKTGDREAS